MCKNLCGLYHTGKTFKGAKMHKNNKIIPLKTFHAYGNQQYLPQTHLTKMLISDVSPDQGCWCETRSL